VIVSWFSNYLRRLKSANEHSLHRKDISAVLSLGNVLTAGRRLPSLTVSSVLCNSEYLQCSNVSTVVFSPCFDVAFYCYRNSASIWHDMLMLFWMERNPLLFVFLSIRILTESMDHGGSRLSSAAWSSLLLFPCRTFSLMPQMRRLQH
jgi:hypothetical protein